MRFVILCCLAFVLAACAKPVDPLTGGTLVYSEDFEGSGLPSAWSTKSPVWKVAQGRLTGARAENEGAWLSQPLPEQVRVTFTVSSASPDGDIKFEIFTDGKTHQSGYVGIFGGWKNSLNIIARLDEHGTDRLVGAEGQAVVKDRVYQMTVVRTDNRVRWWIDGQPFLTYADAAPLRGEGHNHLGFNTWHAPLSYDSVRVYDLAARP